MHERVYYGRYNGRGYGRAYLHGKRSFFIMVLFFISGNPQSRYPTFSFFFLSFFLSPFFLFPPSSPSLLTRRENQQSSSFQKIGERDARYGYRIYILASISPSWFFPHLLNSWPSYSRFLPHHAYIGTTLYLARTTPHHTTP